jgi:alpha-L-fucosidase
VKEYLGQIAIVVSIALMILTLIPTLSVARPSRGGGEANPELATNQTALQNWRDLRFGMFIHWGPVALRGTEIGWSRGREVSYEDYDSLYREFNPLLFDARDWVSAARVAGMKYLVLVTKHHDGFSLWDSKDTEYDIMATDFRRDIVAEISQECDRQGVLFGTYYSILDWYHPDYPISFDREIRKEAPDMPAYIEFMKRQLTDLIGKYGTCILWFDGEWEDPWTHEMGMDIYAWARRQRDDLLINNRVDKGRQGMEGTTKSLKFAGDFETPEQQIGSFNSESPWESCITVGNQWAWKPNDDLKSSAELIRTLVHTVGGDGNLLLNVGPMPDGRIEQRQLKLLKQVGLWLEVHGEAVYGTRGGPVPPGNWGVTTQRPGKVFVHLVDESVRQVRLDPIDGIVSAARLLASEKALGYKQEGSLVTINIPMELPDPAVNVIELLLQ